MDFCPICKHAAGHAQRKEEDAHIKPPYCADCPKCRRPLAAPAVSLRLRPLGLPAQVGCRGHEGTSMSAPLLNAPCCQ